MINLDHLSLLLQCCFILWSTWTIYLCFLQCCFILWSTWSSYLYYFSAASFYDQFGPFIFIISVLLHSVINLNCLSLLFQCCFILWSTWAFIFVISVLLHSVIYLNQLSLLFQCCFILWSTWTIYLCFSSAAVHVAVERAGGHMDVSRYVSKLEWINKSIENVAMYFYWNRCPIRANKYIH